jgi:hypothetical protein
LSGLQIRAAMLLVTAHFELAYIAGVLQQNGADKYATQIREVDLC